MEDLFGLRRSGSGAGLDEQKFPDLSRTQDESTWQCEDERNDIGREHEEEEEEESEDFSGVSDISEMVEEEKPVWQPPDTRNVKPQSAMTLTHINQTQDLLKSLSVHAADARTQTSDEWLSNHSVEHLQLTLKDLVDKGKVQKLQSNEEVGKPTPQIQFDSNDVNEFEYKLNLVIETYKERIKWLLKGSRRIFGLLTGKNIGIVVDCSDSNSGFGRLRVYQESLIHLIDEQLSAKKALYLAAFGTDVEPLWPVLRYNNCRVIKEAKEWVMRLQPMGGCNLLKAIQGIVKVKNIDSVVVILGTVPDQNSEILINFVQQLIVGRDLPIHTVAYDCSNHLTNITLRTLSEASKGRYHCYASSCEELLYTSTDIGLLLKEIQKAQDVINKIQKMKEGIMGNALVTIMNEISTEVAKLPQSQFLPQPPGHQTLLKLKHPKFQPQSSAEWLKRHGLKAKQLDLFQVLAPNAFSYREEFIPIIKKAVQSQVHEKAMIQFRWRDGSMKNIHVDMSCLFEYQKQLGAAVSLYERRIQWLSTESRRIFGTIEEKIIVILVDVSMYNVSYLVHIQHSLRLLLEQQMINKEYFNIISFGSTAQMWSKTLKKPTPENLQDAWRSKDPYYLVTFHRVSSLYVVDTRHNFFRWILDMECNGSRNFLTAFRLAVENEEEIKHGLDVEGAYLFTSGVPDQSEEACCSFIKQSCAGKEMKLHTTLFNVEDYDSCGAIPGRYANITKTAECLRNLAHCCKGRFHWFRETGIIESDDVQCIMTEVEKAINFSKKCSVLVQMVKNKYQLKQFESSPKNSLKMIMYQPSAAVGKLSVSKRKSQPVSVKSPLKQSKKKVITANFFLDEKGATGSVFKKFPTFKSVQKAIGHTTIPDQEDCVTSKEWMQLYSLSRLKLNLNKLASGPACKHVARGGKSTHNSAVMTPKSSCHFYLAHGNLTGFKERVALHEKGLGTTDLTCLLDAWIKGSVHPAACAVKISKNYNSLVHLLSGLYTSNIDILVYENGNKEYTEVYEIQHRYCSIFPSINIKGTVRHLQLLPHELTEYSDNVKKVLGRYLKRLLWLLTGSRRVFGNVVHKRCTFLIDTSGSMEPYMEELKREMTALVWEQLYKQDVRFNFIRFSGDCEKWQEMICAASESVCHDAVRWIAHLNAGGNTCTLEVLKTAFLDPDIDAIYLLTDGKPDTSTSLVLRKVAEMNAERQIPVNTISFNCSDTTANSFLRLLSSETGGRYHKCQDNFDAPVFVHKLLTEGFRDTEYPHLPQFEGDDLQRLGSEIKLARRFLAQSITYRAMYADFQKKKNDKATTEEKADVRRVKSQPFLVGKP